MVVADFRRGVSLNGFAMLKLFLFVMRNYFHKAIEMIGIMYCHGMLSKSLVEADFTY